MLHDIICDNRHLQHLTKTIIGLGYISKLRRSIAIPIFRTSMRIFVVLLSPRFESQLQFSRRKANFSGENNIATLVRLHRAQLHFYVVFPVCSVAEYDRYYVIQDGPIPCQFYITFQTSTGV